MNSFGKHSLNCFVDTIPVENGTYSPSCAMQRSCACNHSKCFHGNPCICERNFKPCGIDEEMNYKGGKPPYLLMFFHLVFHRKIWLLKCWLWWPGGRAGVAKGYHHCTDNSYNSFQDRKLLCRSIVHIYIFRDVHFTWILFFNNIWKNYQLLNYTCS